MKPMEFEEFFLVQLEDLFPNLTKKQKEATLYLLNHLDKASTNKPALIILKERINQVISNMSPKDEVEFPQLLRFRNKINKALRALKKDNEQ